MRARTIVSFVSHRSCFSRVEVEQEDLNRAGVVAPRATYGDASAAADSNRVRARKRHLGEPRVTHAVAWGRVPLFGAHLLDPNEAAHT